MTSSLRIDAMLGSGKLRRLCSIAALLFVALTPTWGQAQQPLPVFTAVIQAPQEVPPILTSNAFGSAAMFFDIPSLSLCYSITYAESGVPDLPSGETAAHFHGPALPGVSAGILFDISPVPSPLGSPKAGCVGPLSGPQVSDLIAGLWYINIHSNAFPGGEIRGQILVQGAL